MSKEIIKLDNQRSEREWTIFDATMVAEGVEEVDNVEQSVEAWAVLIKTETAFSLQGWFGRTAAEMIYNKLITPTGFINWDKIEQTMEEE